MKVAKIKPKFNNAIPFEYMCIYKTPPVVTANAPIPDKKGHGLGSNT
jgi:hypothetical protein